MLKSSPATGHQRTSDRLVTRLWHCIRHSLTKPHIERARRWFHSTYIARWSSASSSSFSSHFSFTRHTRPMSLNLQHHLSISFCEDGCYDTGVPSPYSSIIAPAVVPFVIRTKGKVIGSGNQPRYCYLENIHEKPLNAESFSSHATRVKRRLEILGWPRRRIVSRS